MLSFGTEADLVSANFEDGKSTRLLLEILKMGASAEKSDKAVSSGKS